MSDPSINDIVKGNLYESTQIERDWWEIAGTEARRSILVGKLDFTDTATENAYQQDYTAKFNQIINTNYDSLPIVVKGFITESLIGLGELPNPSVFEGIGHEFVTNPWAITKEVAIECDRCDETFMASEDFDIHKEIDHGDNLEDYNKVEETLALSMNPDITREALQEARRLLAKEENQSVLHRKYYFNGKDIPQPTGGEPDDVKGTVGYNDDPNAGLYNNKKFKQGKASSRGDGKVTEGLATETSDGICIHCGQSSDNHSNPNTDYRGLMGDAPPTDHYFEGTDDGVESVASEDHSPNEAGAVDTTSTGGDDNEKSLGDAILAGDDVVNIPSATDTKADEYQALEGIDFSEEQINFVYPTKSTEAFVEEADPFLEGYGDDNIETDNEAVESQIIDRKMRGYGAESIAKELVMQYGVPHEQALQKVYSIEVSVNDKIANTFFQKKFSECNEAERNELEMYGGFEE